MKRMRWVSKLLIAITLLFLLTISTLGNVVQQADAAAIRPEIIQLSASYTHMSALAKDGTVWMWGQNIGMFGNGSLESSNEPLKNPYLKNIVSVASGQSHEMALDNTGQVWTWGQNTFGQIGDGMYTHYGKPNAKGKSEISEDHTRTIPYLVEGLPKIVRIAAGQNQSFAIAEDGTVWAWGNSWLTFIDRGDMIGGHEDVAYEQQRLKPYRIEGIQDGADLFNGYGFETAFAVKKDGTVWGWGMTFHKLFGPNAPITFDTQIVKQPIKLDFPSSVKSVQQLPFSSIAYLQDGTVLEWGLELFDKSGVNPYEANNSQHTINASPVKTPKLQGFIQLKQITSLPFKYAYIGLKLDGSIWTIGVNDIGQLGTPGLTSTDEWIQVKGLPKARSVETVAGSTFVVGEDGSLWGWGKMSGGLLLDKPYQFPSFGNGKVDKVSISVNGVPLPLLTATALSGGEVTTALSSLKSQPGFTVQYGAKNESAVIKYSKFAIKLMPNSNVAYVNGNKVIMPVKVTLVGKDWIIPMAWLAKSLGGSAQWNADQKSLQIKLK